MMSGAEFFDSECGEFVTLRANRWILLLTLLCTIGRKGLERNGSQSAFEATLARRSTL
jgi:hypothetical protein